VDGRLTGIAALTCESMPINVPSSVSGGAAMARAAAAGEPVVGTTDDGVPLTADVRTQAPGLVRLHARATRTRTEGTYSEQCMCVSCMPTRTGDRDRACVRV
jgi:hypothetical protein